MLLIAVVLSPLAIGGTASATSSVTIVSLTFDDGDATQYAVRSMLSSHGMHGTFYLNSPRIGGDPYYMTWAQINDIYADGNEIAGHSTYHRHLTQLDPAEAQREICYDRNELLSHGFAVTDFAYPFGEYNASVESMVQGCGYNSGRTTDTGTAETVPPLNPYATRIVGTGRDSLSTLETKVTNAEQSGGGWVQILMHQVCNGCNSNAISPSTLTAFLDWLQPRAANGTVVQTVQQVIGGPTQPAVAGPPLPPAPNGANGVRNSSLEQDADADGIADCFRVAGWGNHSATWQRITDPHSGSYAERVTVSNYSSGDEKLLALEDLGYCTPTVTPGHRYTLTTWYKSTAPVYFSTFTRDGNWSLPFGNGASSPVFPASSGWTQASWTTPVIPNGINGLTFGLAIASNGTLTIDDIGIDDANPFPGDTTPPSSTIACNGGACSTSYYNAPVTVSLAATDEAGGSGVNEIVYTTDGTDPSLTNGTVYSAPFTVSTTRTVKYRAYDNAGNAEAVNSILLQVDTTPPTTSISCNGTACSTGWYAATVNVSLSGSDGGGSGVAEIRYTTDGTDPTPTSGTVYAGTFGISSTTTVKFRAFDNVGNAESTKTQTVQIDTAAPTVAITAPANGATVTRKVTITASAADTGGSGIASVSFYVDGNLIGTDTSAPYSVTWTAHKGTKGQHTLTAVARDAAGNPPVTSSPIVVTVA